MSAVSGEGCDKLLKLIDDKLSTDFDVTDIECSEADDVIIFDNNATLCQMAENAETIPYEVLTSISSRVKRVYFWE